VGQVRLRNIFISNEWDNGNSNSLTFAHDFIFGAMTLQVDWCAWCVVCVWCVV